MFARCPETYKPLEPGQTTTYNGNPLLPGWEDSVTHCVVMAGGARIREEPVFWRCSLNS